MKISYVHLRWTKGNYFRDFVFFISIYSNWPSLYNDYIVYIGLYGFLGAVSFFVFLKIAY